MFKLHSQDSHKLHLQLNMLKDSTSKFSLSDLCDPLTKREVQSSQQYKRK